MAIIVIGAATLLARAVPLFDASVEELWGRLASVQTRLATAARDTAAWSAVAEETRVELRTIADDARRAHQRLTGVWSRVANVDRREVAALKEAQRLAETDFPALIAAGPQGNALRRRAVDDALARLDDHLAGASPYLPPLKPIENQAGLDRASTRTQGWPRWILTVVMVDGILLALGLLWWRRAVGKRHEWTGPHDRT